MKIESFQDLLIGLGVFVIIFHLPLAAFATKELVDYPMFGKVKKGFYLIILWLVPILGSIIVHKIIGLGWASGSSSGGNGMLPPGDG